VWVLLNVSNVVVNAVLTHRRLLIGELRTWFRVDVGPSLLAALAVAGMWKLVFAQPATWWLGIVNLIAAAVVTMAAAAVTAPEFRRLTTDFLGSRFGRTG
jgi:hypothetical protein